MSRAVGVVVVHIVLCSTGLALPATVGNMSSLLGSVPLLTSVDPAALQEGLVGHWAFDEMFGTTAHDATGKHNGTLYGPEWASGVFGGGLWFDGLGAWVEVPRSTDHDMTSEMAIAGWICQLKSADAVILCKQSSPSVYGSDGLPGNYEFSVTSAGRLQLGHQTGPGLQGFTEYTSSRQASVGDWHHVCVTLRAGEWVTFYIDGAEAGSSPQSATFGLVNAQPIKIGKHNAGPYGTLSQKNLLHFCGYMDDLYLYNRVLAPEDVNHIYIYTASSMHDYFVNGKIGDDSNYGTRRDKPFATIQRGIDAAKDEDTVWVHPGVYTESLSFNGKAITVQSAEDAAIIQSPGSVAVSFDHGEGPNSVLKNFVIRNATTGIFVSASSPTLKNLTITTCGTGIQSVEGQPRVTNCILWNNTEADVVGGEARYSCIQRPVSGTGNLSADPLFADLDSGDYHLCSERGQYWLEYGLWVLGEVTSPCLDAGDPADDYSLELTPNGGRIDMGAHGGTPYASRSTKTP